MRPSLSKIMMSAAAGALGFALLFGGVATPSLSQDTSASSSEAPSSEPTAPSDDQILAGLAVWKDRGGCFNCHGTFGQGGEGGHFPAGPSLRKTQLDAETLHLVIACGLPTTKMPYNLKGAYVESDFCYGITDGVPADSTPGAALSDQEITDLVAYIEGRLVGQRRITKAQCVEYSGNADEPECAAYR